MAKHGGAVDPSLVKACKRSKDVHRQYRLGMGSWTESSSEDERNPSPQRQVAIAQEASLQALQRSSSAKSPRNVMGDMNARVGDETSS